MIGYSATTGGFYSPSIHGNNVPKDVVQIMDDRHKELLAQQSQGLQLVPDDNGYPIAVDPLSLLSAEELYQREYASVIAQRKARYIKTDELRAELEFDALSNGVELDLTPWIQAVQQVKADLPLPVKEA